MRLFFGVFEVSILSGVASETTDLLGFGVEVEGVLSVDGVPRSLLAAALEGVASTGCFPVVLFEITGTFEAPASLGTAAFSNAFLACAASIAFCITCRVSCFRIWFPRDMISSFTGVGTGIWGPISVALASSPSESAIVEFSYGSYSRIKRSNLDPSAAAETPNHAKITLVHA